MKNLIIAASDGYRYSQLQYWVNSIHKSGFDGDIVVVAFNMVSETIKKLTSKGVKIYAIGDTNSDGDLVYRFDRPVHTERFYWISEYLRTNCTYDLVITTDIKDVIFQSDPSKWLRENQNYNNDPVVGSESIRYRDEPWGNQNLLETFSDTPGVYDRFKDNEIYNVGVLAGPYLDIENLCFNIYINSINRPTAVCEQAVFNVMMNTLPYGRIIQFTNTEDDWVVHMGTTMDPSKEELFDPLLLDQKPKFERGLVCNYENIPFAVVHQYDRNPTIKAFIQANYGDTE